MQSPYPATSYKDSGRECSEQGRLSHRRACPVPPDHRGARPAEMSGAAEEAPVVGGIYGAPSNAAAPRQAAIASAALLYVLGENRSTGRPNPCRPTDTHAFSATNSKLIPAVPVGRCKYRCVPQDGTGPSTCADHTRANRSTYDTIAPLYARNQVRLRLQGRPSFAALRSAFRASLPKVGLIADIGCGPAYDAAEFAGLGLQVMGLDLSAGMLACADRALVPRLAQADMRALPLATGRLAGIWCVAALLHVEENRTSDVLREFRRVLCPAGALALVTASGENQGWETAPYAPLNRRWFVYRQPERLRKELATVGFVIVSEEKVELGRVWWACLAKVA
jgi:SAM-dependent methyltransferase